MNLLIYFILYRFEDYRILVFDIGQKLFRTIHSDLCDFNLFFNFRKSIKRQKGRQNLFAFRKKLLISLMIK